MIRRYLSTNCVYRRIALNYGRFVFLDFAFEKISKKFPVMVIFAVKSLSDWLYHPRHLLTKLHSLND